MMTAKRLPPTRWAKYALYGPQVMRGYWNRPDETEKGDVRRLAPDRGHWAHHTGEGFVFLEDRKKDMILVSGFSTFIRTKSRRVGGPGTPPAYWKSPPCPRQMKLPARLWHCSW